MGAIRVLPPILRVFFILHFTQIWNHSQTLLCAARLFVLNARAGALGACAPAVSLANTIARFLWPSRCDGLMRGAHGGAAAWATLPCCPLSGFAAARLGAILPRSQFYSPLRTRRLSSCTIPSWHQQPNPHQRDMYPRGTTVQLIKHFVECLI